MWGAACVRLMCRVRVKFPNKAVVHDAVTRRRGDAGKNYTVSPRLRVKRFALDPQNFL